MKQLLTSFTQYEHWANERLLPVVLALDEAAQQQVIVSSFPSIYKTFLHIWDANTIWWQRLQRVEEVVVPSLSFHPTMAEIEKGLLESNRKWIDWVKEANMNDIEAMLPYKTMKGDAFTQPVYDILLHLSNHGSYYRGQLVTMLRQLGVNQVPQIDYILFARSV